MVKGIITNVGKNLEKFSYSKINWKKESLKGGSIS